ncbi:MAG: DNA polymerase IV [Solirubrobacterales bacterium]
MAGNRCIAHLDMDAFYASVELRRRPELRGKPVVVCGSGPRAVVTTASYEARRLAGIQSAMPAATARRRLPDAIFIAPDFEAYRSVSREVMAIVRDAAETVEVVGLDEAYLDLSGLSYPKATMRRIATWIREATGLSCSVGIGESKLLAKVASELAKPAGLVRLGREEAIDRFAGSSPGMIPGIGPKTVRRLESLGVRTLADLRESDLSRLQATFGERTGHWLHSRSRFQDAAEVEPVREAKSQSTETTFDTDVASLDRMERAVLTLSRDLCARLRARSLSGRSVAIKVRLDDWTTVTRARTLEDPTDDPATVGRVAVELLREYSPPRPVRLLGVRVAGFGRDPAGDGGDQLRLV